MAIDIIRLYKRIISMVWLLGVYPACGSFLLFTETQVTSPGATVFKLHLLPQSGHTRATSLQFSRTPLTPTVASGQCSRGIKMIAPSGPKAVLPFAASSDFITPSLSIGVISASNVPK